LSTSAV